MGRFVPIASREPERTAEPESRSYEPAKPNPRTRPASARLTLKDLR